MKYKSQLRIARKFNNNVFYEYLLLPVVIKFVKMTTSIEKIVDDFLYPIIETISNHPNYNVLSNLHQILNDNATAVHIYPRDGVNVHLTLTATPAV